MIAAWFDVQVSIELGILAKRQQTTVQDLVAQGIDYVFRSHGMPEIAGGARARRGGGGGLKTPMKTLLNAS